MRLTTDNANKMVKAGLSNPSRIPKFIIGVLRQKYLSKYRAETVGDNESISVIRTNTAAGPMFLHPDDPMITREILSYGTYDKELTQVFDMVIQPGDTIIDVGANVGYFTLLASNLTGGTGNVISFEPENKNYEILLANVNNFAKHDNISIENLGISDKQTSLELSLGEGPGGHKIGGSNNETQSVDTVILDEYINSSVDLVKIDVEGVEPSVFRGMTQMIKSQRPILIFEYSSRWESKREIADLFTEFDYKLCSIDEGLSSLSQEQLLNSEGKKDILGFPR